MTEYKECMPIYLLCTLHYCETNVDLNSGDMHIVLISHTDEGLIGKFYPEYHFSSRVAPSQLKKPRGMKSDMRGKIF